MSIFGMSLPSRERGLKFLKRLQLLVLSYVAPLAGAWIEILITFILGQPAILVAPLAGAWIEIYLQEGCQRSRVVAPLAGAWIEIILFVSLSVGA